MYCMKCGKEINDSHVFCDDCLEVMDQYPVKKGTPIHLPSSAPSEEKKATPKWRQPTIEERLFRFQKATRWLSIALVSTLLMLGITIALLLQSEAPVETRDIGKNYNTVSTLGRSG